MTNTDTTALVLAAKVGSEPAFAALVEHWAPRVHRFLTVTGTPHHDADDLVQDTWLRVHRNLMSYDVGRPFSTWLFTIAHRLRLTWATRRRHDQPLIGVDPEHGHGPEDPDPPNRRGIWAIAHRVLSASDATTLWLRYGEDLEPGEIASILGSNALAVRVRLHRARVRLAPHLTEHSAGTILSVKAAP